MGKINAIKSIFKNLSVLIVLFSMISSNISKYKWLIKIRQIAQRK